LIGTFYQQDIATDRLFQDVAVYSERIMGPRMSTRSRITRFARR
jgi:hypothetical protein